jgi:CheY-like chemotaxis protein
MDEATKVLIVEDSRIQAKIMSDHVRDRLPYEVIIAETLAETREILDQEGKNIFVAVLDLHLPDDPGGEIVALAASKGVPSVVMTSSFNEELRQKLLEQNVVDYFLKTMAEVRAMEDLIERLHKNLSVKVLVVDDSKLARNRIVTLLTNQNYQTVEAENGKEALKVMEADPEVRMVITDYNMPQMDGFQLITELRKTKQKNQLAIIGVSGADGKQTARFLKIGANDFLQKPVQAEEFYCRANQQMDIQDMMRLCMELRQKNG